MVQPRGARARAPSSARPPRRLAAASAGDGGGAAFAAPSSEALAQQPAEAQREEVEDAVLFVRAPLAPGATVRHDAGSVVVLGDVPAGCRVAAAGDVVVLGRLDGEAVSAGARPGAMVAACLGLGAAAAIEIDGVRWSSAAAAAQDGDGGSGGIPQQRVMAVLEPAAGGSRAMVLRPLPGGIEGLPGGGATTSLGSESAAATAAAAAAKGAALTSQLLPAAVLALGIGLAAAPSALLGGLVGGGAEGPVGALLEALVFGYVLLRGAGLLAEGSELLLEVLDPGIIGGVVLPVLGALPDALIVISSGLKGTVEEAQEQLAVGMGTLAGSTVLLLSLGWGLSVWLGRCDLSEATGRAIDRRLTRRFDLERTGVTTDDDVRRGALVMAASALLYGSVQVPAFLGATTDPQVAREAGCVLCAACMYVHVCMYVRCVRCAVCALYT